MKPNYLKDTTFLKYFDSIRLKKQTTRITVLDFNENPIREIQGEVTTGSINLDGSSAMRRTCNLTMIAKEAENDLTNINYIISINKKVKIEMGIENNTHQYPEHPILQFPLGTYVVISPSITHNTGGCTISLQLKDKMCLLNGECGGVLPATVEFHRSEYYDADSGQIMTTSPTIYQIIQELVNHFGGEQLSKIIISDVDERSRRVKKWTGKKILEEWISKDNPNVRYLAYEGNPPEGVTEEDYTKQRFDQGEDVGYEYTDFTYPGELIGNAGSSVVDVLEQIKNTLGNYEYFYDIDGNFIFQEIKNYLNTSQSSSQNELFKQDVNYVTDFTKGKSVYTFEDGSLINSYSNSPQYSMIKNDFVIQGKRETSDGVVVPIRYHLAIDTKPELNENGFKVFSYEDEDDGLIKYKRPLYFDSRNEFPLQGVKGQFYYDKSTGKIYRWGLQREDEITGNTFELKKGYIEIQGAELTTVVPTDQRTELYLEGVDNEPFGTESNFYYTELANEQPKIYDVANEDYFEEVKANPADLDYYLDIIDTPSSSLAELSVQNIGRRTKVIDDDKINCVFSPEIPEQFIIELGTDTTQTLREECEKKGSVYIQVESDIYNNLDTGGGLNSAYNQVRELLYEYTSYNESVSLTTIPIFYLEPNTRITVRDAKSGIYGDYMIKSISMPLDIGSTMSISCTRALERF